MIDNEFITPEQAAEIGGDYYKGYWDAVLYKDEMAAMEAQMRFDLQGESVHDLRDEVQRLRNELAEMEKAHTFWKDTAKGYWDAVLYKDETEALKERLVGRPITALEYKRERDQARQAAAAWKRSAKMWRFFAMATVKNYIGKLKLSTIYQTARHGLTVPPF